MEFGKEITTKTLREYLIKINDLVFNQLPVPVAFVNSACKIVSLNDAFLDYLGMRFEDVKGKFVGDIDPNARLPIVIKTGKPEIGHTHKFKDRKEVVVHRIPIFYDTKIIGAMSIIIIDDLNYVYNLINENHLIRNLKLNKNPSISNLYYSKYTFKDILTNSQEGQKCKHQAKIFSKTDFTVLITGESGVGKEIFAHAIHNKSSRGENSFVRVNCAAIPESLIEAELFGYEEGAFTGACKKGKIGKFELANGGTIFLDEIGDLPLSMQAKLLRVLQENEIERIGSNKIINIDVRVIAATNCNLIEKVKKGEFRSDLFYRLNVLNLEVPPLRKRKADIPVLMKSIADRFHEKYGILKKFPEEVINILSFYDWPGNVRELNNIAERMMVICENEVISIDNIPDYITKANKNHKNSFDKTENKVITLKNSISEIETKIIKETLILNNFNKSKTAKALGIPRMTLYRKLKEIFNQCNIENL